MPSYLVSFHTPGGQTGLTYGSHIVDLPEAPSSAQSALDLQASLAMEYGTSYAVLLTWDLLPDSYEHPGGNGPYCYFATFSFTGERGTGLGSTTILRTQLLRTLSDLRSQEEYLRSKIQAREVHLVSCKAMREPLPELVEDYQQLQRFNNSE